MSGMFYLLIECENCEEDVFAGPVATTIEHLGLPVVPYDMAAQTRFECDNCGAAIYTGDFQDDVVCEGGRDVSADDADEDESEESGTPPTDECDGHEPGSLCSRCPGGTPGWTPAVGDAVQYLDGPGTPPTAVVIGVDEDGTFSVQWDDNDPTAATGGFLRCEFKLLSRESGDV